MPKPNIFKFRKMDTVGAADAEDDTQFLESCFVDTGLLKVVKVLPWTTHSSVLFGTIKADLERGENLIDDLLRRLPMN